MNECVTRRLEDGRGAVRPRLLDLFCGAGGCSVGYMRAGFDVVGVDLRPQPRYPFEFHEADALTYPLEGFDVVHASPPCQDHSQLQNAVSRDYGTAWMLAAIRSRLIDRGRPWIIENVVGAPMVSSLTLCGSEFGLGAKCHDGKWRQLRRHRLFESSVWLMGAGGCHHRSTSLGVYGEGSGANNVNGRRGAYQGRAAERVEAMGIDWMKPAELAQAIPPAYCQFLGEQILTALQVAA